MLFLFIAVFLPLFAGAAGPAGDTGGISIDLPKPIACEDFQCVLAKVIEKLTLFAVPLVTLMALIGGFQFMTAGGDPKKVEQGKHTLWYAAVGYAVIFMANGLILIIKDVLGGE